MRRFLPLAGLAAGALVLTSTSNARADSGDGYLLVAAIALFDVASIPADIYMAAKGEKVPRTYAMAEAIGGGVQAVLGGVGIGVCSRDPKCRDDAGLPVLIGFTAWTTAMTVHGLWALGSPSRMTSAAAPKPSPFTIVPMVGDARTTPAGVALVGTF
jgi:hypothetical protein